MARELRYRAGMNTLVLLATLIASAVLPAQAQSTDVPDGTQISSAQVSGLELTKLSPELQEAIGKLAGTPLNRQQLRELAARIEAEQPRYVAALRVTAAPDGGAKVVFVVARMRDPEHQANVNTKYIVAAAKVTGVSDKDISPEVRADLQALIGKPLDADQAERLETRLKAAFPDYDVTRTTDRGDTPGQITLIYALKKSESARWLRFQPLKSNALYHSDQGWGAYVDVPIGTRDIRVTPLFALDTADDLVEEYSGLGVRFETRKLGTERLGASFEWSWFDQSWRDQTVAALALNPGLPGLYEDRTTLTPLLTFAITRHLSLAGGVSIVELDPFDPLEMPLSIPESRMANAAVGSIGYNLRNGSARTGNPWTGNSATRRHLFDAAFTVRSGMAELESDYAYTRSVGSAVYSYEWARHQVIVSGLAGVINGDAPLFERFTLGDSRTLRGWNKYDIAPAGGDQVVHASVEYRYRVLALFVDTGSVWNKGGERQFRVSTGFGVHTGPFFMTVGFPVNTDDLRAVFTIGLRMPLVVSLR
jgi:hypothetical protein